MMGDLERTVPAGDLLPESQSTVIQPASEPTQMMASVECPVCRTPNPPAEVYCMDCGFLLSSEPEGQAGQLELVPPAVLTTRDGTREFALHAGQNTVGRQDADVLLTHNTVSRKHAVVTIEDGKVYVEDIGSTNGTFVAGKKLEPGQRVELADGAEVVFGNQSLILKLIAAAPEPSETTEKEPQNDICETQEPTAQEPEMVEKTQPIARLVSADGSLSYSLAEGTYAIGRREDNDIVICDPYCSGRHAELRIDEGLIRIIDLESTNGTWVNGVRIGPNQPREIKIGDEMRFGNTVLRVEALQ